MDQKEKWRVVSSRVLLPIKIRILPSASTDVPALSTLNSTIHLDLLPSAQVGSTLAHLGTVVSPSPWYILTSDVEHTRYFHVDLRSGQLMLIRPMDELKHTLSPIRLRLNVTRNWIDMETVEVNIRELLFSLRVLLSCSRLLFVF